MLEAQEGNRSVVWLTGAPCAGKTFLGDFLATHHGFVHIDGDDCSRSKDPDAIARWTGVMQSFGYWFRGEPAPNVLWQPHYTAICQEASDAVASGKRVVVTFAAMTAATREFAASRLEAVTWVWLEVSEQNLIQRNLSRLAVFLDAAGMSKAEYWDGKGDPNVVAARARFGPWSEEAFSQWQSLVVLPRFEPLQENERGVTLDNNELEPGRGGAIDTIGPLLGLGLLGKVDTNAIAQLNIERYKNRE